jgi:hypothetical protein
MDCILRGPKLPPKLSRGRRQTPVGRNHLSNVRVAIHHADATKVLKGALGQHPRDDPVCMGCRVDFRQRYIPEQIPTQHSGKCRDASFNPLRHNRPSPSCFSILRPYYGRGPGLPLVLRPRATRIAGRQTLAAQPRNMDPVATTGSLDPRIHQMVAAQVRWIATYKAER